jgi:hypothetical protein
MNRELLIKTLGILDKHRILDALRDEIRAELAKPLLDAEQVHLAFPTMLRKMWSAGEVQNWLDSLPPLYSKPIARNPMQEDELREFCNKWKDFDLYDFARALEKRYNND